MEVDVHNKVVVVTGSGNGIGREIALALGQMGAKVIVNDIGVSLSGDALSDDGGKPADRVVAEIRKAGGKAVANFDSVASYASANAIIESALDNYGRIDAVINNAGNLRDRYFHNMTEEEWSAVISVHLDGTFFVSRRAADHFRKQESGAFVHMTSTSGLIGNFGQANYGAAKLGIVALSKMIALDMARFNVRSNCIAPSAWSRMTSSIPSDTPQQQERVAQLKKMEANKIAPMACFLISDAAKEVNAQIFAVRANEIMLMSQPRPVRSVHDSDGWTPQKIADIAIPAMKSNFYPLERSPEVMCWDPI